MDMPDRVRALVDELGEALVAALIHDARCRELARELQELGYDLALGLEASPLLRGREEADEDGELPELSEADKAFLQTFRIKLDD